MFILPVNGCLAVSHKVVIGKAEVMITEETAMSR